MEETTTPSVSTRSVGIKYGLIMGLVSIAYFVILNTLGVDTTKGLGQWASLVFLIAIFVLAHKYFKDNGDGYMSFGQGLGIGFWITLISSLISSVFTYIYVKFIDTSYIASLMDKQRVAMEERGGLTDEQMEAALSMSAKFMTPEMIVVFAIFGGIIIGMIVALLVTIFTQKKNPEAFV
jgi:Protein of unknown function (DUF4199)